MIRREDAQYEFGAGGGVGRIGGRQFQIGGVLDGQNMVVGVGGVGGLHASAFLASLRSDWGSRPENGDANGSWPIWGIKFLRSVRVVFAQWLSLKLPSVPRFHMECERNFCKNDGGGQQVSRQIFRLPRIRYCLARSFLPSCFQ